MTLESKKTARYSYAGLTRPLHEPARLGIMTSLIRYQDGLSFGDLKDLCSLTDGNLNRHLKVLESEKLITIEKPSPRKTFVKTTKIGIKKFLNYMDELEKVIKDGVAATKMKKV